MSIRRYIILIIAALAIALPAVASRGQTTRPADGNWPQFRGPGASGVSATPGPLRWDVAASKNIRWKVPVPGLGHSSPVVWDDRIFLTTAVPAAPDAGDQRLKTGLYGDVGSVREQAEYRWLVLCFDKSTGKLLWEREARRGVPKVKRHPKSTHANPTPAADAKRIVAFFGSEGLYCFDHDGKPLWQKDFGVLDSGFFVAPDAQWGFASSPVLFEDSCVVLADVQKNSFITALNAANGEQLWRTPRNDVPTWGTPTVHHGDGRTQILVNGYKEIAGYDLTDGRKLWTLSGGGDIPVPTPHRRARFGLHHRRPRPAVADLRHQDLRRGRHFSPEGSGLERQYRLVDPPGRELHADADRRRRLPLCLPRQRRAHVLRCQDRQADVPHAAGRQRLHRLTRGRGRRGGGDSTSPAKTAAYW